MAETKGSCVDVDVFAGQVRGIVAEAIYEAKRGDREVGEIADGVAIKVYDLLAAALGSDEALDG